MEQITRNLGWAIGELKRKKLIGGYETVDIDLCLGTNGIYNIISGRNKYDYDLTLISEYIYRKDPETCQQMWRYISGMKNLQIIQSKKLPDELPKGVRIILSTLAEDYDNSIQRAIKLAQEIYRESDES